MERRRAREVRIGSLAIGGDHPIRVQSLTTSKTSDVDATVAEIERMVSAGCEIVRVAVFDVADARALAEVRRRCPVPLVADIHFNHKFALMAVDAGVDKVRLNPGNIAGLSGTFDREGRARVAEVAAKAKAAGVAMRVGVNSGSVEKDLLEKHGWPKPEAMVESALRHCRFLEEECDFHDIVVSLKTTTVATMVESYRRFARESDLPLHLGVTEAGPPPYGILKSAIGIGALLLEGIGDTIRVSLTGDKTEEVRAAYDILKATGRRVTGPEINACPECGRIAIDLERVVREVRERIAGRVKAPMKISILGCAVNGPGEAKEADIGLAGGRGEGWIFRRGRVVRKVKEAEMVDALVAEILAMEAETKPQAGAPGPAAASP